jgi:hypothetical protein
MKKPLAVLLAVTFLSTPAAGARPFAAAPANAQERYDRQDDERFTRDQLENLLAPVALYPDPLLAQILVAATFVNDIEDASSFVRRYRDPNAIDDQPWDVSVKAVAHYPSVIHMMADRIDWTIALGQAYVEQPEDVMASVQVLRRRAHQHGNLASNRYHEVIVEREYVEIVPILPEVLFVPVYEPVIFFQPAFITFGVGFPIGVWLNFDCDWRGHRVFYHGWRGGRRWIDRSRPRVRINNVYVNNNFNNVRVNRDVVRRNVNVANLNRFNAVNREARFDNVERRNRIRGRDGDPGNFRTSRRDADNPRNDNLRGRPGVAPRSGREDRDRGAENRSIQPQDRRQQSREENRAEARERLRQAREQRAPGGRRENPAEQTPDSRSLRSREERPPEGRLDRSQRGRDAQDQNRAEARERLRQSRESREQRARVGRQEAPADTGAFRGREPAPLPRTEAPQGRSRLREERPPQDNPANRFRGRDVTPPPRVDRGQQSREDRQAPANARSQPRLNPPPEAARPAQQRSSRDAGDIGRAPRGTPRDDRSVDSNKARGERQEAREKRKGIESRDRGRAI